MKGKKDCMKKGGAAGHAIAGGDVREGGDDEEDKITKMNTGGKAPSKAHKARGHKMKARADKRPRLQTGGKVSTPKSPLTGAMPQGLPGGGKGEKTPDKSND